jgi:putative ABC transport system permease protein
VYLIALKMLFGDRSKYLGLVLGVAFTTLLVNQQVGILLGLLDRAGSAVSDASEADIWVMDPGVKTLDIVFPLRDTELPRVRSVAGVAWAVPLFKGGGTVRTPTGTVEATVVYGVDDSSLVGTPQTVIAGRLGDLRRVDAVALDVDGFRRIWPGQPYEAGRTFELNDRRAVVVAVVEASPSFASGPVVYTRYSQALQFTNNGRNQLSFILVKAEAGRDLSTVATAITFRTGLKASPATLFKKDNVQFVIDNTGIPTSFATVVALGVIVGVSVVGLLTNLFVLENLKQFAALKAIGVRNHRLVGMVLAQAATAGGVGWALGLGAAAAFFQFAGQGDPNFRGFILPWFVAAASAALAASIMVVAAAVGLRRVLFVDPAVVFRG